MALDGCGQLCKWILILVNLVLALVGLAMLAGGLYLRFSAEGPLNLDLKTNHFILVVSVLITVGAVLIATAIAGVLGACNGSKSALGVFCTLMIIITVLTIIAGVLAFNNMERFSLHIGEFYATVYAQYIIKRDWIRSIILKLFNNTFNCCGLGGAVETIMGQTDTCPQSYNLMGMSFSFSTNCLTAIMTELQASSVLGGFLGAAAVMLVALGCSILIYYSLKNSVSYTHPAYY